MVVFVLVEYKNARKTISYIKHLNEKLNESAAIAIVDNSFDFENTKEISNAFYLVTEKEIGNCKYLQLKYDKLSIFLFKMNSNLGYARGNNFGIKTISEILNPEFLIVSNNDIKIENDYLDLNLFRNIFRQYCDVAVIGPYIVGKDGKNQSPCKKMSFLRRWILPNMIYPLNKLLGDRLFSDIIQNIKEGYVYRVQGSFMVIDLMAFSTVEGFDNNTFLYSEESILSEKLSTIGKRVFYTNQVKLLHDHDQTIGNFYNLEDKLRLRYESELYYYKKYLHLNSKEELFGNIMFEFYLIKLRLIKRIRK